MVDDWARGFDAQRGCNALSCRSPFPRRYLLIAMNSFASQDLPPFQPSSLSHQLFVSAFYISPI